MLAITKKPNGSGSRQPYKPGADRQGAERFPGGKLKSETAPTLVYRMREHGKVLGLDPRLGSVLGVMGVHRELSDAEIAAGFAIAEIYGRYEMLQGMPRRTIASPSYERGFGNKSANASNMDPDEIKRHKRAVKRATKQFDKLQNWLGNQAELVERVCVLNERPGPANKGMLATVLHEVATRMGMAAEKRTFTKTEPRADDGALLAFGAVEALVSWFFNVASSPTHFSLVANKDWKASRGITATDGRYHHTIPVPLRGVTAEQMDAKLRLACAQLGILEIKDAETGEVE